MQKLKKGQNTIEVLILFAGVLLLLAMITVSMPTHAIDNLAVQEMRNSQKAVNSIADAVDYVYLAGEGAERAVWIKLPEGWNYSASFIGARTGVTDWSKRRIIDINYARTGDIIAYTRAPVCGKWPNQTGRVKVLIMYNSTETEHITVNDDC